MCTCIQKCIHLDFWRTSCQIFAGTPLDSPSLIKSFAKHISETKQRAHVPAMQKDKLWQRKSAAKWGFISGHQEGGGDKTQIHPNMVFELGILFKAEEQRLGLIMA